MKRLKDKIKEFAISRGAELVGFAAMNRFEGAPEGHRPVDILPEAKTVVVCTNAIPKGVIMHGPATAYHNMMEILRYRLDFIAYEIANFIEKHGGTSVPITSDGPYFEWDPENLRGMGDLSHKHAAEAAGLGKLGKNSLLITHEFGNRAQLVSLVTDLDLESDPLVQDEPCPSDCMICIESCPVKAIDNEKRVNQSLCRPYMFQKLPKGTLIEGCRICRKVCPAGNQDSAFKNESFKINI